MASAFGMHENLGYSFGPVGGGNPTISDINASNVGYGFSLFALKGGEVTDVGFCYWARGAGTPVQHVLTLQSLDADGMPNGDIGGGSPTATNFTPPADTSWNNTFQWLTLSNPYTFGPGDAFAVTIEPVGTPDASNYSRFARRFDSQMTGSTLRNFPYSYAKVAGTWDKANALSGGAFAFKISGGDKWGYPCANVSVQVSTVNVGDIVAKGFLLPTGYCDTFSVRQILSDARIGQLANRTVRAGVWDENGDAVQTCDYNTNITKQKFFTNRPSISVFTDSVLPLLDSGVKYYAGYQCVESDSRPQLNCVPFTENDDRLCMPNGGNICTAYWNGSSWTEYLNLWPTVQLQFEDWNLPSGGGAGPYSHSSVG